MKRERRSGSRASGAKKCRPANRLSLGDYGTVVLQVMYRLRGGTCTELSEDLVRDLAARQNDGDYSLAERGRNYFERGEKGDLRLRHRTYLTLRRLEEQKLVGTVSLPRRSVGGRRYGRPELYYELTTRGAGLAGELCGVSGTARELASAYGRHGSRARGEEKRRRGNDLKISHARTRNFIFRCLVDDAAESGGRFGVDPRDLWGESHPAFPIFSAKFLDANGEPVAAPGRRRYEQCEPDGYLPVYFPGGLSCTFLVELEMATRTHAVAAKIDRYAAHALREHETLVSLALAREISELERESLELDRLKEQGYILTPEEHQRRYDLRLRIPKLRKGKESGRGRGKDSGSESFYGLPESVLPVLFILPTGNRAQDMQRRLLSGGYEMPRLLELTRLWSGDVKVDFGRLILFGGLDSVEQGRGFSDWVDLTGHRTTLMDTASERQGYLDRDVP